MLNTRAQNEPNAFEKLSATFDFRFSTMVDWPIPEEVNSMSCQRGSGKLSWATQLIAPGLILTLSPAPSTPSAHVAILCNTCNIPFAYLAQAADATYLFDCFADMLKSGQAPTAEEMAAAQARLEGKKGMQV